MHAESDTALLTPLEGRQVQLQGPGHTEMDGSDCENSPFVHTENQNNTSNLTAPVRVDKPSDSTYERQQHSTTARRAEKSEKPG